MRFYDGQLLAQAKTVELPFGAWPEQVEDAENYDALINIAIGKGAKGSASVLPYGLPKRDENRRFEIGG